MNVLELDGPKAVERPAPIVGDDDLLLLLLRS